MQTVTGLKVQVVDTCGHPTILNKAGVEVTCIIDSKPLSKTATVNTESGIAAFDDFELSAGAGTHQYYFTAPDLNNSETLVFRVVPSETPDVLHFSAVKNGQYVADTQLTQQVTTAVTIYMQVLSKDGLPLSLQADASHIVIQIDNNRPVFYSSDEHKQTALIDNSEISLQMPAHCGNYVVNVYYAQQLAVLTGPRNNSSTIANYEAQGVSHYRHHHYQCIISIYKRNTLIKIFCVVRQH
jgi:hypothetical protein